MLRRLIVGAWDRLDRRTLDEAGFRALLAAVGFSRGSVVLVHSSMDILARRVPGLDPVRIIGIFQELLGAEGTLAMPTLPFTGRQLPYVDSNPTFDTRRTPSRSGLLTEVFRRMPGVVRSRHPVSPVAAWGARSGELTRDHHRGTGFGETSPYWRLAKAGGLEIGLGTPFWATFSLLHVAEERDPSTRAFAYDFEQPPRLMKMIEPSGVTWFEHRPLRGDRNRDFAGVERILLADGTIRSISRRGLRCQVAPGARLVERGRELIGEGRFWFGSSVPRDAAPREDKT